MLFDGHLILGYLIAKFLLEVFRVKSTPFHALPSLLLPPSSPAYGRSTSRMSQGLGMLQRLWRWFLQVPQEQRLMLWALGASVLPDLDVLFTPLFGWHTFHRGITHSIFVMTAAAGGLAYFGTKVLQVPFAQALAFTALPLLSHPLTDTAVNYGTKLFWPFSNALMSTGAITIWDLPFTIIMYTFLTMSRLHLMRPTPLFAIFLASFVFYIAIRRIMIYEAAIRVRGVEPRYDTRLWVMPSNIWPGFYYVMYHKFGEQIRIATTVWTDYYYLRITESLFYPRWLHVRLTPPMRSYFWNMEPESMSTIVFDSLPTVLFIVGYHVVYYFLTRSGKQQHQQHHAQAF